MMKICLTFEIMSIFCQSFLISTSVSSNQICQTDSLLFYNNNIETKSVLQVCGLPQCSDFNIWLYVVLPASVALVMVAVILAICCMRQGHKKPLSVTTSSPR